MFETICAAIRRKARRFSGKLLDPRRSVLYMPWQIMKRRHGPHRQIGRIRQISNHVKWRKSSRRRRAKLVIAGLLWPLHSVLLATIQICKFGAAAKRDYGVGRVRQFLKLLYMSNRHNMDMDLFYMLRMFAAESLDHQALSLDLLDLSRFLLEMRNEEAAPQMDNKMLFHDKCVEYGLPTAPVYAHFHGSTEIWFDGRSAETLTEDLFVKPTNMKHGIGGRLLRYSPQDSTWSIDGRSFGSDGLIEYLRLKAQSQSQMVQPRVRNHPEIARLSLGGLCTIRMITQLLDSSEFEVLAAGIKMPVGDVVVDNVRYGGMASVVNPATGVMSIGQFHDIRKGDWARHPDTGQQIESVKIPRWDEVLALCERAHRCFSEQLSVGWDIVVGPDEVSLLEGNVVWGAIQAQMAAGPIGATPFLEPHIKAWEARHGAESIA